MKSWGREGGKEGGGATPEAGPCLPQVAEATCSHSPLHRPCLTTAPLAPRRLIKLSVAHTVLLPLTLRRPTYASSRQLCEFNNTHSGHTQRIIRPRCLDREEEKEGEEEEEEERQCKHVITREQKQLFYRLYTQTRGLHAANRLSQFRGGVFYLASTHRSPPLSDLFAAFFLFFFFLLLRPLDAPGEDKAVTDAMRTKPSVTSYGYCFSLDKAPLLHVSNLPASVSISWQNWAENRSHDSRGHTDSFAW